MTEIVPNLNEKQELQQASLDFGPGQILAEARHRAQLTVQQIAENLHIKTDVIEALERDDYRNLPPRTFVRGYLKGYAEIVGIDADLILSRHSKLSEADDNVGSASKIRRTARVKQRQDRSGILIGLFLVIITAALAWFWWNKWGQGVIEVSDPFESTLESTNELVDEDSLTINKVPSLIPPAEESKLPTESSSEPLDKQSEEGLPEGQSNSYEDQPVTNDAVEATALERTTENLAINSESLNNAESPADVESTSAGLSDTSLDTEKVIGNNSALQDSQAELLFRFSGDSWMLVKDADGKRLIAGTVKGPAERKVKGKLPIDILIGNSGAVELDFNGQPYDFGPKAVGRRVKFELE